MERSANRARDGQSRETSSRSSAPSISGLIARAKFGKGCRHERDVDPELKQFIERQIKAGRFENASDAICDGLRLLEQRDHVAASLSPDFAVLRSMDGSDIMTVAFIVMMEAAKSAREDLSAIMAGVKAINVAKSAQ